MWFSVDDLYYLPDRQLIALDLVPSMVQVGGWCTGLKVDRCRISLQILPTTFVHSITLCLRYPDQKIP